MSKWKKIGSVHSGDDNKSNRSMRSRSRDQMPTQSFHENIARMKMSTSELIDSQNTYFCKNYIDRKKQTSSNRSHSRIKTEKSLTNDKQDIMRSTISKRKISKEDDNESRASSGADKLEKGEPKKLKKYAKQGELKQLKEDHYRLKEYVKYQINSFKNAFKELAEELKYEINYRKQAQTRVSKSEAKVNPLVPIVPFHFDSKILDSINFYESTPKKNNSNAKMSSGDINVLNLIKTEARLCIQNFNQLQDERARLMQKYKEINLQELLS